ncbi:11158_t:CDS:2, partial [Dentiscutata erythropus]
NSVDSFMDKIKKESESESFCEGVIDLTIDSFLESDFPNEDLNLSIKNDEHKIFSEEPVINYFTKELTVKDLHFSAVPIEYPATSNE